MHIQGLLRNEKILDPHDFFIVAKQIVLVTIQIYIGFDPKIMCY